MVVGIAGLYTLYMSYLNSLLDLLLEFGHLALERSLGNGLVLALGSLSDLSLGVTSRDYSIAPVSMQ